MIRFRIGAGLIVFSLLMMALCGCSGQWDSTSGDKLSVYATGFPEYDVVRAVAGDAIDLYMILPVGSSEIHNYDPSLREQIAIAECDLLVLCGGESDTWVDTLLQSLNEPPCQVRLMDVVEPVHEDSMEEHDHQHQEEYDEHVWTSPVNMMNIVRAVTDKLMTLDPDNAQIYAANAATYILELQQLDRDYRNMVAEAQRRTIVVGDRFPFLYLAREYGLSYYAAFPGCADSTEENIGTTAGLIDKVREMDIPVVFHVEMSNCKTAQSIAAETGATIRCLHSCHNVTAEEFESGTTYIDLMRQNLTYLREALN